MWACTKYHARNSASGTGLTQSVEIPQILKEYQEFERKRKSKFCRWRFSFG